MHAVKTKTRGHAACQSSPPRFLICNVYFNFCHTFNPLSNILPVSTVPVCLFAQAPVSLFKTIKNVERWPKKRANRGLSTARPPTVVRSRRSGFFLLQLRSSCCFRTSKNSFEPVLSPSIKRYETDALSVLLMRGPPVESTHTEIADTSSRQTQDLLVSPVVIAKRRYFQRGAILHGKLLRDAQLCGFLQPC